eukprot:TRINITY_DN32392_c0_g1_i3.p1 TRINITY_DN32392_c0_g1~~TRINITY_DN32392_c0_g1_i3.p1  ORF type:complete len:1457 (-),score=571.38 TRINITY_DN32392_c0_g1_i3:120-4490(-)
MRRCLFVAFFVLGAAVAEAGPALVRRQGRSPEEQKQDEREQLAPTSPLQQPDASAERRREDEAPGHADDATSASSPPSVGANEVRDEEAQDAEEEDVDEKDDQGSQAVKDDNTSGKPSHHQRHQGKKRHTGHPPAAAQGQRTEASAEKDKKDAEDPLEPLNEEEDQGGSQAMFAKVDAGAQVLVSMQPHAQDVEREEREMLAAPESITNYVTFNGREYARLDNQPIDIFTKTCHANGRHGGPPKYMLLPRGWEAAEANADAQYIIRNHHWGSDVVTVLGWSYAHNGGKWEGDVHQTTSNGIGGYAPTNKKGTVQVCPASVLISRTAFGETVQKRDVTRTDDKTLKSHAKAPSKPVHVESEKDKAARLQREQDIEASRKASRERQAAKAKERDDNAKKALENAKVVKKKRDEELKVAAAKVAREAEAHKQALKLEEEKRAKQLKRDEEIKKKYEDFLQRKRQNLPKAASEDDKKPRAERKKAKAPRASSSPSPAPERKDVNVKKHEADSSEAHDHEAAKTAKAAAGDSNESKSEESGSESDWEAVLKKKRQEKAAKEAVHVMSSKAHDTSAPEKPFPLLSNSTQYLQVPSSKANAAPQIGESWKLRKMALLREEESKNSKVLVKLGAQETVKILKFGEQSGKRVKIITSDGQVGWMSTENAMGEHLLEAPVPSPSAAGEAAAPAAKAEAGGTADTQLLATSQEALGTLRQQLQAKKHSELLGRAKADNISADEITTAEDADNPKKALVELIFKKEAEERKRKEKEEHDEAVKKEAEERKQRKDQDDKERTKAAAEERKRENLMSKKHSEVLKQAREAGLSEDEINTAEDSDSPKAALVGAILQKDRQKDNEGPPAEAGASEKTDAEKPKAAKEDVNKVAKSAAEKKSYDKTKKAAEMKTSSGKAGLVTEDQEEEELLEDADTVAHGALSSAKGAVADTVKEGAGDKEGGGEAAGKASDEKQTKEEEHDGSSAVGRGDGSLATGGHQAEKESAKADGHNGTAEKKAEATWNPWGDEDPAKIMSEAKPMKEQAVANKAAAPQEVAQEALIDEKKAKKEETVQRGKYMAIAQGYPSRGRLLEQGWCQKLGVKKLVDVKARCDRLPSCSGFVWNQKRCYVEYYAGAERDDGGAKATSHETSDRFLYLKSGVLSSNEAAAEAMREDIEADGDLAHMLKARSEAEAKALQQHATEMGQAQNKSRSAADQVAEAAMLKAVAVQKLKAAQVLNRSVLVTAGRRMKLAKKAVMRMEESKTSSVISEVEADSSITIISLGQSDHNRIKVRYGGGEGWISVKNTAGEYLVKEDGDHPVVIVDPVTSAPSEMAERPAVTPPAVEDLADASWIGTHRRLRKMAIMRSDEDKHSQIVAQLAPGKNVTVIGVGMQDPNRVKVLVDTVGQGWISIVSAQGEHLIQDDAATGGAQSLAAGSRGSGSSEKASLVAETADTLEAVDDAATQQQQIE